MGRWMAKARPLRKTGRKSGGKPAKEARSSTEVKRTVAKDLAKPKPAERIATRKPVPARPSRKAPTPPERQMVTPEIPPPLPAPIASFTF